MIQVQEEVKKEIIAHECRNIELTFEPGKTVMTEQDQQLVAVLIKLYDFESSMQNYVDKMFQLSVPISQRIEELGTQLEALTATFKQNAEMADKLSDTTYLVEEASIEKLTEEQVLTTEKLQDHHQDMLSLYEDVIILQDMSNHFITMEEDEMNALYDEHSEICSTHVNNYEINSINIVTYDDEYEKFLGFRDVRADRRKMFIEMCDEALNRYTNLNTENSALYHIWDEFAKRCNLIRKIAGLHSEILSGNFN